MGSPTMSFFSAYPGAVVIQPQQGAWVQAGVTSDVKSCAVRAGPTMVPVAISGTSTPRFSGNAWGDHKVLGSGRLSLASTGSSFVTAAAWDTQTQYPQHHQQISGAYV